jgi:hypothetical protein
MRTGFGARIAVASAVAVRTGLHAHQRRRSALEDHEQRFSSELAALSNGCRNLDVI